MSTARSVCMEDGGLYIFLSAVWVLPSVFNATEKCVHCHEGLATPTSEVNRRFIALSGLCERAQGRLGAKKTVLAPKTPKKHKKKREKKGPNVT